MVAPHLIAVNGACCEVVIASQRRGNLVAIYHKDTKTRRRIPPVFTLCLRAFVVKNAAGVADWLETA